MTTLAIQPDAHRTPPLSFQRRLENHWLILLALLLLGYALLDRGFAYVGIAPLYIGEIVLLPGIGLLLYCGGWRYVGLSRLSQGILLLIFWGLIGTVPYYPLYGVDALRDAAIWGYALFALIVEALLLRDPLRLPLLLNWYRRFILILLIATPILWCVMQFGDSALPRWPANDVPIIAVRGQSCCVHLAGAFAYLVLIGNTLPPLILALLPLDVLLNIGSRSAMLTFLAAVMAITFLEPFRRAILYAWLALALILSVMALGNIRIELASGRTISLEQVYGNIQSLVGRSDVDNLDDTKEWRLEWWKQIIQDTLLGPSFWTGKGYGINLADEYGFQTDGSLRSPHNGHMTILARSGVPGFALWALLNIGWVTRMLAQYRLARRRKDAAWSGLFLFLTVYWLAFLLNGATDVFLEGPMGSIWFWTLFGLGAAADRIYTRCPDTLPRTAPNSLKTLS